MPSLPKKGESKKEFIARCMTHMADKESDRPREQAAAVCYEMWERRNKKK